MQKIKHIKVIPYEPSWPRIFEAEAHLIQTALGDNGLQIHHIGSTSVPGLAAKPTIDMIAVVKDGYSSVISLEKVGFAYKGEWNIPFKFGFTKRTANSINLHVLEEGHPEIEVNLLFRNHLRSNPLSLLRYAKLKEDLLTDSSSFQKQEGQLFAGYTLGKDHFIRTILAQESYGGQRFLKATHTYEWQAVRNFRDTYFFGPYGIKDPYTWTFNHPEHAHLVLYQGIDIIGYVHIQFWPDQKAAIRMMAIDEDKRNQNSGSMFLALIEKWLKRLGIKSIHAESRQSSLRFYLKNGYTNMPFDDPENHESDPHDVAVGKVL
jgi:GrpB-like predicted nucleotidyltransferase (UPF0157 family)/GNAT superfamily N-acetyltransferase